ncbi:aldehyde dehydrogenase family protein [Leifsonia naganoensis]|uniref:Aldehyde dehydrogenase n=1 Tax=Leifsonia naganoensis TaxID=150025 RepID=A0A853DSZ3_9MICO|nr:aldehyde dehydrogenase family protein [Leifsonia naganoensis]NYK09190.1 aldehyde dehydrogenase (NAD+) [Leifsonia naganoensis]
MTIAPDARVDSDILSPTQQADVARAGFAAGITKPLAWRQQQLIALEQLLRENGPAFEDALYADLGKPPIESFMAETGSVRSEIGLVLQNLEAWTSRREVAVPDGLQPATAQIVREPLGTVLVISPWNYPVHLLFMPVIAAIAAGNAVVIKPSELAPATSAVAAALVPKYLDPRAIRIVEGGVEETTELLSLPWDHIFYTGNGVVGRVVMEAAAKHLSPVTLELGGKSPVWVDGSADLAAAAHWLVWGKFLNAGQTCVAPDYILTTKAVQPKLVEALAREIADMYGTDPHESRDFGRIVNTRHHDRLVGLLPDTGVAIGGVAERSERYLAPTVLTDVTVDDPVMKEEIFGPILPIVPVADSEAAIGIINRGDKPLALYVFTTDDGVAEDFLTRTSSGSVGINAPMLQLGVSTLPFGGVGASGMGSYHGEFGIRTFSHERAVLTKRGEGAARYGQPPFSAEKIRAIRGLPADGTE